MAQVSVSQTLHAQNQSEVKSNSKTQGTLKTAGGEYSVEFISETESISKGASEFLQAMNQMPEDLKELFEQHSFVYFSPEMIEVELEILDFMQLLETTDTQEETLEKGEQSQKSELDKSSQTRDQKSDGQVKQHSQSQKPAEQVIYSSLFSLARSFNQTLNATKKEAQHKPQERSDNKHSLQVQGSFSEKQSQVENRFERFQNPDKHEEQKKNKDQNPKGHEDEKKRRQNAQKAENKRRITGVSAVRSARSAHANVGTYSNANAATRTVHSIENIYIRFMALMARILGQAEAEAHDLYLRIKERTDNVDLLTLFISKINSEKGGIDWTKNEEMKKLVDRARQIGVDIPEGKYKWTDDEKKLLKENVQMRKDSMEKVTQLERTDMQRYLQEASQCHQARSNVLKLLKEVMDTIIANMRP